MADADRRRYEQALADVRAIPAAPRAVARDDRCGTKAGASVHQRRGEPVCDRCRGADSANRAKWAAANRDRDRASQAAYYQRHQEDQRQRSRDYRAANRDDINARRRAAWRRKRDAETS